MNDVEYKAGIRRGNLDGLFHSTVTGGNNRGNLAINMPVVVIHRCVLNAPLGHCMVYYKAIQNGYYVCSITDYNESILVLN
ncbi:hypothetical protein CEXT_11551 [Caerostris extrusa]|uniref:Uncharacterized protein n=1 Tax=Caerostris extrusa TaxID=172846 RepID=A0AAV4XAN3_CAEEX|nr:hypothetical protein CEXT_11551 [Caerostris extrusa]